MCHTLYTTVCYSMKKTADLVTPYTTYGNHRFMIDLLCASTCSCPVLYHHYCQRLASCGPLCVPCGGAGLGPRGRNQYSLLLMMTVVLVHTRVVAVSVSELMLSEEEGDDP